VSFDDFIHEKREIFAGMGSLRIMNYYTLKFSRFKKKFFFFHNYYIFLLKINNSVLKNGFVISSSYNNILVISQVNLGFL